MCRKCRQELPGALFEVDHVSRDGLATRCRACLNAQDRARSRRNPDVTAARRSRWRARRWAREANDPGLRERRLAAQRAYDRTGRARHNAWRRARYRADPAFRERVLVYQRRWQERRRAAGVGVSHRPCLSHPGAGCAPTLEGTAAGSGAGDSDRGEGTCARRVASRLPPQICITALAGILSVRGGVGAHPSTFSSSASASTSSR